MYRVTVTLNGKIDDLNRIAYDIAKLVEHTTGDSCPISIYDQNAKNQRQKAVEEQINQKLASNINE